MRNYLRGKVCYFRIFFELGFLELEFQIMQGNHPQNTLSTHRAIKVSQPTLMFWGINNSFCKQEPPAVFVFGAILHIFELIQQLLTKRE